MTTLDITATRKPLIDEPANNTFVVWYDSYDEPYTVRFRSDANAWDDGKRWFNADQVGSDLDGPSTWSDMCEELRADDGPHLLVPDAQVADLTAELDRLRAELADTTAAMAPAVTIRPAPDAARFLLSLYQDWVKIAHARLEQVDKLTAELAEARQQIASMRAGTDGTDETYLIWSNHHKAWWGPDSCGYRSNANDAGRYTLAAARKEMTRGCGCCEAPEVPVLAELTTGAGDQELRSVIAAATKAVVEAGDVNRYYQPAVVTVELPAEVVAR